MLKRDEAGVWSVPNAVSFLALFFAWVAILFLLNGHFFFSYSLALLAFVLDAVDGFLARMLHQESAFGRQLDGFVDVFVFLIYPALVFYLYLGLQSPVFVLIVFTFLATGILRLVRFNMEGFMTVPGRNQVSYPGLPVFCNHITILFLLALRQFSAGYFYPVAGILLLLNSILMVLKFPFPKPRTLWPFLLLILLVSGAMAWMGFHGVH